MRVLRNERGVTLIALTAGMAILGVYLIILGNLLTQNYSATFSTADAEAFQHLSTRIQSALSQSASCTASLATATYASAPPLAASWVPTFLGQSCCIGAPTSITSMNLNGPSDQLIVTAGYPGVTPPPANITAEGLVITAITLRPPTPAAVAPFGPQAGSVQIIGQGRHWTVPAVLDVSAAPAPPPANAPAKLGGAITRTRSFNLLLVLSNAGPLHVRQCMGDGAGQFVAAQLCSFSQQPFTGLYLGTSTITNTGQCIPPGPPPPPPPPPPN